MEIHTLVLVCASVLVLLVAAQEPYILVGWRDGVDRLSLDGRNRTTLVAGGGYYHYALAYDYEDDILFYSTSKNEIRRCSLSSCTNDQLLIRVETYGMAVDYQTKRLYWTNYYGGTIESANYTGLDRRTLVENHNWPTGLTLDLSAQRMYWIVWSGGAVRRVDLDGTNIQTIRNAELQTGEYGYALTIDVTRQKLYWGDYYKDELHEMDVDGQSDTVIQTGRDVRGISVYGEHLYYTDYRRGGVRIQRQDVSGDGTAVQIADGIPWPRGIVIVTADQGPRTRPYLKMSRDSPGEGEFVCSMPTAENATTKFLVDWISGTAELVSNLTVTAESTNLKLEDVDTGKVSANLSCRVRSVSVENGITIVGPEKQSNVLTARVQVVTRSLRVTEGLGEGELNVILTMPPVFFHAEEITLSMTLERHSVELRDNNNEVIDQAVVKATEDNGSTSRIVVDSNNWDHTHTFLVKARQDGRKDGTKTRTMSVNMSSRRNGINSTPIKVDNSQLTIEDRDSRSSCKSWNDPRQKTFDGWYYDNQNEGEFVFYKHLKERYQINLLLSRCSPGSSGTCNCAVAIRANDDVVVLDKCERLNNKQSEWRKSPLQVYVLTDGNLSSGLSVWSHDDGRRHVVAMPHGGEVTVTENSFGALQVSYKPVPEDFGNTVGLCGTYDGDRSNDLMLRNGTISTSHRRYRPNDFIGDWRARSDEGTFAGVQATNEVVENVAYCSVLENQTEKCAPKRDKIILGDFTIKGTNDNRNGGKNVTQELLEKFKFSPRPNTTMIVSTNIRRKRSSVTSTTFDPFQPFVADVTHQPADTVWPTASGLTEQQARDYCNQTVTGDLGVQQCTNLMADNFTEEIDDCVDDIGLTDELNLANATIQTIIQSCLTFVNALDNSAADNSPPPPLQGGVDRYTLMSSVCPNNCSGNGDCRNGSCVCGTDRTSYDCSMSLSDKPEISFLAADGLCDTSSGSCDAVFVYGNKFQDRDTLSCHLQQYQLGDDPSKSGSSIKVLPAKFIKYDLIVCSIPAVGGPHLLQVSNDGVNPAPDKHLFLPYNSTCQDCSYGSGIEQTTCSRKLGTCFISEVCYLDNDRKPTDPCEKCESTKSVDNWTVLVDGDCQPQSELDLVFVILIVVIVCIVIMLLVAVLVTIHSCRKSASNAAPPTSSYKTS